MSEKPENTPPESSASEVAEVPETEVVEAQVAEARVPAEQNGESVRETPDPELRDAAEIEAAAEPPVEGASAQTDEAEPEKLAGEEASSPAGDGSPERDPESGANPEATKDQPALEAKQADAPSADKKTTKRRTRKRRPKTAAGPIPETGPVAELHQAMLTGRTVKGKVIGWNDGGFHVVTNEVTAFCPQSEMETGKPEAPASYVDNEFDFRVLEIQEAGRRIVVSRNALLRADRGRRKAVLRDSLTAGEIVKGRIASLTDFGAFVDLGGVQGLVHVSEISRTRVQKPSDVLEAGQEVTVKILKVEQGGKRISLSMKALEPDPWDGVADRFEEGAVVRGTVEKTADFGAFVALEPGLTGLLPSSGLSLPRGASLARFFPRGKELSVQILRVDPRRRRISLALEGSRTEGSRSDYKDYVKGQKSSDSSEGFNALAAAFEKLQEKTD